MSEQDKKKWDKKYSEMADLLEERPPSKLLTAHFREVKGEEALDLACGSGRHALFLAQKGFHVDAVDISEVALKRLGDRMGGERITLIETDLDHYEPDTDSYDLIVMTNYLDRALIERAKSALKPGGIFIVETYMHDPHNEKKDSNPLFLLKERELLDHFEKETYEILEYREFWNEEYEKYRMKKEGIAARKKSAQP